MKTEDIRITQYALGELTGAEREAFEKEMAADPELLEEVRQTQQFCESVPVASEPEAVFSSEEREALIQRIRAERMAAAEKKSRGVWSRIVVYGGLAAAACWLVSLNVSSEMNDSHEGTIRKMAKVDLPTVAVAMDPQAAATPVQLALTPTEAVAMTARPSSEAETPRADQLHASLGSSGISDETRDKLKTQLVERSASSVQTEKVPHTGDIPLAGRLFSSEPEGLLTGNDAETKRSLTAGMAQPSMSSAPTAPDSAVFGLSLGERGASALAKSNVVAGGDSSISQAMGPVGGFKSDDIRFADEDGNRSGSFYREQPRELTTEGYDYQADNRFLTALENPLSTFSIDVDTASYSNIRRFLQQQNQLPPKGAVRTEELINYFPYTYPQPEGSEPFSVNVEVSQAPWNPQHELVRIGLKGRELAADQRPASNFVFLIDVSGSMDTPAKLPLLQKSLTELTARLSPKDRVAIVVYAGSSGLVLPSTTDKNEIREALSRLKAGGSTNGGSGIKQAYREARENFLEEGNNRVILCTDGDFNVGITSEQALVDLIEKQRASGIFLSVLGFGTGNLKDSQMEKLADKGNGNYAYIDSISEGRKVLGEQMSGTLFTIAKDVKIQVEFNPATVAGYRLIGYENRVLAKEDFNNDKKDAGEIGAGHTVTAFYEVVPAGQPLPNSVDALKYQPTAPENPQATTRNPQPSEAKPSQSNELLTVKLRYKQPDSDTSSLLQVPVANEVKEWNAASADFRFAAAVAALGQKLRGSPALKDFDWAAIQKLARPNLGDDPGSYRAEFLTLIEKARQIDENP